MRRFRSTVEHVGPDGKYRAAGAVFQQAEDYKDKYAEPLDAKPAERAKSSGKKDSE